MAYSVGVTDEAWVAPARAGVIVHENQPRDGLDFALTKGTLLHGQITEGLAHTPVAGAIVTLVEEGPVLPEEYRAKRIESLLSSRARTTRRAQGMYHFRVLQAAVHRCASAGFVPM